MTSVPPLSQTINGIRRKKSSILPSQLHVTNNGRAAYEGTFSGFSRAQRESLFSLGHAAKPVDFGSPRALEAMSVMRKLLLPVVMRKVLRMRKQKRWPGNNVMREYTPDSVIHAIRSSNSMLASWPEDMLGLFAEQASFFYLEANEYIVYMNESYISSGIVVLLHGKLTETRNDCKTSMSLTDKQFETQQTAPAVFCEEAVLCRDCSSSCIRAYGYADVAVLPTHWVWDIMQSYVLQRFGGKVLDCLKFSVVPLSEKIMNKNYYPTSLVLRRSWIWPLLSSSDRVKLARKMWIKVFCIGDTLFSEGDLNPYIYIIRRGIVKAVIKREVLTEFDAGASFGEVSVLFDEPRCCRVVATTMCEVYCLHRRHLMKYLIRKPHVYGAVINKALQRRLRWLEDGKKRDIMDLASLLAGVPCLSQTTEKVRTSLAMIAKAHVLPPQRVLFTKGTLCEHLFVIGRGKLSLRSGGAETGLRTTTEFVGELCLSPHFWSTDVVTCTSVDGWSLHVNEIMKELSIINADAQAVDICRQGLELYRAQHGPDSVIGECRSPILPSPKTSNTNGASPHLRKMMQLLPDAQQMTSSSSGSVSFLREEGIKSDFDWNAHAMEDKSVPMVDIDAENKEVQRHGGDQRSFERSIESELKRRVGELVSLSVNDKPSAVDCDFSEEVEDIQQMLVEQIFLIPTKRQPRFLRQINHSKITLVMDDGIDPIEEVSSEATIINDLTMPQQVVPQPMVYTHDGIVAFSDGNPLPDQELTLPVSPRTGLDFAATAVTQRICTPETQSFLCTHFGHTVSEEAMSNPPKSRLSGSLFSVSRQSRPFSGFTFGRASPSPFFTGCNQRLSRAVSFCNRVSISGTYAISSQISETTNNNNLNAYGSNSANGWGRGKNVDISQQAKISTSLFQSALDRYVKVNEESYFQDMVRVCLPSQTEEQWFEEEKKDFNKGKSGLVLVLMHIRRCEDLQISDTVKSPIVKVSTGSRVFIRTPVMCDRERPVWPIEEASFISFIRRDTEICFTVCDAEDEKLIAYKVALPAEEVRENGGVGIRSMHFNPEAQSLFNPSLDSNNKPWIEVCMMAVTASKYSNLQKYLAEEMEDEKSSDDFNVVYLQVLGVKGLKHRIEASISVTVDTDGKSKEILRTLRATPKTRTPSWPGQSSFCVIKSDGVVSFDLYHRDLFLASYDTPVDTIAFGGTGIYDFPLTRAQGKHGEVYGNVLVSILGIKASSSEENALNRLAKVLVVHVESFKMTPELEEFTPDPFVILRGPNGEVILHTPLSIGTYNASWTEEEASCFISCPLLAGSIATYRLEVYDNNESNMLGAADMAVTMNGTRRNCMRFLIGDKGFLTVSAYSFSIHDVFRQPRSTVEPSRPPVSDNSLLLSVHVSGCDNLQGTGFDEFQIDPLVTARLGRRRIVVAPLILGTTAPRWPYPKATFVIPVSPELLSHITLEVWDTNIELCDVLGVARIPIQELCQTGTHIFALQPHKDQEFGRRQNLGTVTVKSRFGRINGEVVKAGLSGLLLTKNNCPSGLFDSRIFQYSSITPDLPVTRVRLHISSCYLVPSNVFIKSVKVGVLCLQHVLFEVAKNCSDSNSVAWPLNEAQTFIDLRAIYGRPLRLAVTCSSTFGGTYETLGASFVPFSTLVSSVPEEVSVHSFPLLNHPENAAGAGGNADGSDGGVKRTRGASVSVDVPSVTISLLAVDASHAVGE